jgi:hypothetical protein
LAPTSLTSGSRSVGIVCLWTQATGCFFFFLPNEMEYITDFDHTSYDTIKQVGVPVTIDLNLEGAWF